MRAKYGTTLNINWGCIMDKELLRNKFEAGRNAIRKAVDFQILFFNGQRTIWEGYVKDAYHKQAYSWSLESVMKHIGFLHG